MDKEQARAIATDMLKEVIRHQPTLLEQGGAKGTTMGAQHAEYCMAFIEKYSEFLIKKSSGG